MMATEEIELIDLEKALVKLWDEEQGKKLTRACFFNLVIFTTRESHYLSLIDAVLSKFPCRVFLISSDTSKDHLKTSLSSHRLSEGIFCEIIKIEVSPSLHERVPFIILPHILPDLPLYLLWTEDPSTENTILPKFEPFAKRVIFDVAHTSDLQKTSQNLLAIMKDYSLEVSDLHWSAMKGWRKIFSSIFDTPLDFRRLISSRVIRITYNQMNHMHRAAYFQGWLASRLGWQFKNIEKNEGNVRLAYQKQKGEVAIFLVPREEECGLPLGSLLSIEIEAEHEKSEYIFKRALEGRQVLFQFSNQNECALPISLFLSGMSDGGEIIDEIFYPTKSTHYRSMLENLAHIPWGRL